MPNYTYNDTTIEAANLFGSDTIEQIFDVLVRIRDVRLGGVMTKRANVVDHDLGGMIGLVRIVRREEVDGRMRMTRSWNPELVPTFGLELSRAQSQFSKNAILSLEHPLTVARTSLITHLLSHVVPRRSEQSLFNIF